MGEKQHRMICAIESILSASAISIVLQLKTSNIITPAIALILFFFYQKQGNDILVQWKKQGAALIVSLFWTMCMTLQGTRCFETYDTLGSIGKLLLLGCIFVGMLCFFYYLISWLYRAMEQYRMQTAQERQTTQTTKSTETAQTYSSVKSKKLFGITMLGMLLSWLPHYLKNYPAVIISDSMDQIGQAVSGVYSNHHPVVQTWIIELFLKLGKIPDGSLSTGIAIYCVVQMLFLAAIYAYVVTTLYQYGVRKSGIILTAIFYAWMPYNVMYSINIWKDTLFSASVLLFTLILWRYLKKNAVSKNVASGNAASRNIVNKISTIKDICLLVLSGCGMSLLRNNGFYAFVVTLPFILILFWKKEKRVVAAVFATIVITLLIKGPVFQACDVKQPDMVESLSIPIQQIARVVSDGAELSWEQQELLEQIIEVDKIAGSYNKHVSDPMKALLREKENQTYLKEHKAEYLKLWMTIGIRHPAQYLSAYIDQTEGYWYPDVQEWVFTEGVCENKAGIVTEPKMPAAIGNHLKWAAWNNYRQIPIYGFLWSIGGAVWMTAFLAGYCYYTKHKKELVLFIPLAAIWATLLVATPVYAEFRYLYAVFICLPLYIANACAKEKV